jgi:hypothetical protein
MEASSPLSPDSGTWLPGVEEALPPGERVLWSGRPELWPLAFRVLHLRALVGYWVVATGFLVFGRGGDGRSLWADLAWMGVIALVGTVLIVAGAAVVRATTLYALTERRVVLRIGVALPVVLNLPLHRIESVDLRLWERGRGDVVLTPKAGEGFGWALLWPHLRPWNFAAPQPALKAIPNAGEVGRQIAAQAQRVQASEGGAGS